MNILKRIFCLVGNCLPPKLNCFFYKLSGVKFNPSKVWIGNKCYLDTYYPENIEIENGVCISSGVSIITHFDPTKSIKNHPIKRYKKKVIFEEGVFVGTNSTIMPGVIIRRNTFIKAGSVITKSTNENTIVYGNPQKEKCYLSEKLISSVNYINKKYHF